MVCPSLDAWEPDTIEPRFNTVTLRAATGKNARGVPAHYDIGSSPKFRTLQELGSNFRCRRTRLGLPRDRSSNGVEPKLTEDACTLPRHVRGV